VYAAPPVIESEVFARVPDRLRTGESCKQLRVTESETGTILSAGLDVPGKPLYSHLQAARRRRESQRAD
jgi:hypothetical protein